MRTIRDLKACSDTHKQLTKVDANASTFLTMIPKRSLLSIVLVGTVSLLIVTMLFFQTDLQSIRGGFSRNIKQNTLVDSLVIALPFNSYYVAGFSGDSIFLGSYTSPTHLLVVIGADMITKTIQGIDPLPRTSRIRVDSPFVFVEDIERHVIHGGSFNSLRIDRSILKARFFADAIPLSQSSVVQRTSDEKTGEYVLAKSSAQKQTFAYTLLEKQIDGIFCTDGMYLYNKERQKLIYIYFYRNQFICTDTSLNLLFRHNTIDTISRAKIEVAQLTFQKASTLSSPPYIVNRRSATSDSLLLINSSIPGESETEQVMKNNSVIDVYSLSRDGKYLYSFYLPNCQGYRVNNFSLRNNTLVCIYDRFMIQYIIRR